MSDQPRQIMRVHVIVQEFTMSFAPMKVSAGLIEDVYGVAGVYSVRRFGDYGLVVRLRGGADLIEVARAILQASGRHNSKFIEGKADLELTGNIAEGIIIQAATRSTSA